MMQFTLNDMSCGHCAAAVTKAIKALDAEAKIDIDLSTKLVKVESLAKAEDLAQALTEAGYAPG
ncbi:MAG: heavy-metal-associated domain-containing protein [Betaproteobacteria bacterium]|nr:heavy-metal-associated domain-containing protein [Betaproteobacteria bacterium]